MLKCSGCNCTYYWSRKCPKEGWYKYHKCTCKFLKNDGTQSSKEQYMAEFDGKSSLEEDDGLSFYFYYTIDTETQTKLYCVFVLPV